MYIPPFGASDSPLAPPGWEKNSLIGIGSHVGGIVITREYA